MGSRVAAISCYLASLGEKLCAHRLNMSEMKTCFFFFVLPRNPESVNQYDPQTLLEELACFHSTVMWPKVFLPLFNRSFWCFKPPQVALDSVIFETRTSSLFKWLHAS